ncbi:MAG: cystathionine gamma-synthase family protein [Candidatus Marinimicrobia bacterium]|nr:cystathionine gamma-synthase family protein [Candidatus Neomarinimicrobiota bacterium]MCF7828335.1 cystathionine gamma-synthase family protein [Candidatus Neomarinimicrobiota bacterium]MCF7879490.1 cystathionine gamma-synthase family protein [Candidatus Neomarinimicrobiota bacterium]
MSRSHKSKTINDHRLSPESLMMSYGYKPEWSEGAIKCPIFQTSTFVFETAEEGKAFFEVAYGLREQRKNEKLGLIYSRLNNPDLEILEDRLTLWDDAEAAAVFESGMSAITTTLLEVLRPGDAILHSEPVYGGTDYLLKHILPEFGIKSIGFPAKADRKDIVEILAEELGDSTLGMIYIETPANPTNDLIDIRMCRELADEYSSNDKNPLVAVDNTFLGPLWQHPLKHGADLVLYSATKYIGGHSDLIAGVCLGSKELIHQIQNFRTITGTMCGPWTGWMLLRSLETLKLRMTSQVENAKYIGDYLNSHSKVNEIHYLGNLTEDDPQYEVYQRQCEAPGAMISFTIEGGEAEAFRFLNALQMIHLAVSLGGTESLAEHPGTMTHADITPTDQRRMGITPNLVRLSIGVENKEDIRADLNQALEAV